MLYNIAPHDLHIVHPTWRLQVDRPGPKGIVKICVSVSAAFGIHIWIWVPIHGKWGAVVHKGAVLPGRFIQS